MVPLSRLAKIGAASRLLRQRDWRADWPPYPRMKNAHQPLTNTKVWPTPYLRPIVPRHRFWSDGATC